MRVLRLLTRPATRALAAALALALVAPAASAAEPAEPRIVNGSPAGVPWQAAIIRRGDQTIPLAIFCGATIRDANHVITAAHCVPDSNAADLDVAVGFQSRYFPEAGMQRVPVSAVTSHPGYEDMSKRNDLAILTLATPLRLGGDAGGLPVVPANQAVINSPAYVSGWGTTSSGGEQPYTLMGTSVLVYPDEQCANYGAGYDPSVMLCAGWTQGGFTYDSCQGDSGGPLARMTGQNSVDRLVGIVSFGRGCADPQFPGIYTKLSNADLNARALVANPPPRLEPAGQPAVAGTPRAGEMLSCSTGGWTLPASGTSHEWLTAALDAQGRVTDLRVEGAGQTLALDAGDVGRIVTCEETAVNDGGARTVLARPIGPIEAALPPAPPPAPSAPSVPVAPPAPPVVVPPDIVPPRPEITRRNCARRRCTLTITATDSGGPATSAAVTYQRLTGCRRGRRGARCRAARTIAAKATGSGVFEATTPRLALARWRFSVVAADAAGNRNARPVAVVLTVARDRPRARAKARRGGRRR